MSEIRTCLKPKHKCPNFRHFWTKHLLSVWNPYKFRFQTRYSYAFLYGLQAANFLKLVLKLVFFSDESYSKLMDAMNATEVKALRISYGTTSSGTSLLAKQVKQHHLKTEPIHWAEPGGGRGEHFPPALLLRGLRGSNSSLGLLNGR